MMILEGTDYSNLFFCARSLNSSLFVSSGLISKTLSKESIASLYFLILKKDKPLIYRISVSSGLISRVLSKHYIASSYLPEAAKDEPLTDHSFWPSVLSQYSGLNFSSPRFAKPACNIALAFRTLSLKDMIVDR